MEKSKNYATPTVDSVAKAGDNIEMTGVLIAGIGALIWVVALFTGGSIGTFALIPVGILIAIAGHTKKIATAAKASYILHAQTSPASEERA